LAATTRRIRTFGCLGATAVAVGLAACGGDDGGSESASVGDCIDADKQVVDCGSQDATHKLVSDQDEPDAIACIEIGDKPQTEVEVGGKTFCAEEQ
jgi:hypothetical protein